MLYWCAQLPLLPGKCLIQHHYACWALSLCSIAFAKQLRRLFGPDTPLHSSCGAQLETAQNCKAAVLQTFQGGLPTCCLC